MSCTEFTTGVFYDPWVVPHQLLPAMAVVLGIDWRMVFLIMYSWETLEVIFLNCLKISEEEHVENALISDPAQCFMGVVTAMILMNVSDMEKPLFTGIKSLFWASLFILPGIPLIFGGDHVWFYVPCWFFVLFLLHKFGSPLSPTMMVYFVTYSVLVSVLVFLLKDHFNSFYTATLTALFVVIFALIIKNFVDY